MVFVCLSDALHSWSPLCPSLLLQVTSFHSVLWLSSVHLYTCCAAHFYVTFTFPSTSHPEPRHRPHTCTHLCLLPRRKQEVEAMEGGHVVWSPGEHSATTGNWRSELIGQRHNRRVAPRPSMVTERWLQQTLYPSFSWQISVLESKGHLCPCSFWHLSCDIFQYSGQLISPKILNPSPFFCSCLIPALFLFEGFPGFFTCLHIT